METNLRECVVISPARSSCSYPPPPLADVTSTFNSLETSETAAATRAKETVEARNAAKIAAVSDLQAIKAYVQGIADASPDDSDKIISSAGLSIKKSSARTKSDFTARPGPTTGTVRLVARAASRRASYEWQSSIDGAKTWQGAPSTLQSKTTLAGFTVGTVVQFRFRAVTVGEGDWRQTVSLLVS